MMIEQLQMELYSSLCFIGDQTESIVSHRLDFPATVSKEWK